jgi:LysR family transcriptional regulator, transcription activator of glutamate synthase operon
VRAAYRAKQHIVLTAAISVYDQSVELRQLVAVEAVARHRHFTRAAEELHLAQSALSHQIRRLERELGIPLFERTSRRVVPTEAGLAIAARARRVAAEIDGARQEIDELQGTLRGHLWIGPLVPAGDVDVPGLLAGFSQAYPGIEVGLREGVASDMFRRVAADELDAAFSLVAGRPPPELAVEPLGHEDIVVAFAPDRAPRGASVSVADLAGRTLVAPRRGSAITSVLEERFAAADRPLRLALESGDPYLLRALAARGFAAAVLPDSLTLDGPALATRRLRPAVRLPVALVWRRARHLSPAGRAFIDFVRRDAVGG